MVSERKVECLQTALPLRFLEASIHTLSQKLECM